MKFLTALLLGTSLFISPVLAQENPLPDDQKSVFCPEPAPPFQVFIKNHIYLLTMVADPGHHKISEFYVNMKNGDFFNVIETFNDANDKVISRCVGDIGRIMDIPKELKDFQDKVIEEERNAEALKKIPE